MKITRTFATTAASLVISIFLAACGGGGDDDPATAASFQLNTVSTDRDAAAAGSFITATAEFETFGPTISEVFWRSIPIGDASGTVEFDDPFCDSGQKNVRSAPGTDKQSAFWRCITSVTGVDGAKGGHRLIATAIDSNGNTAIAETVITITP